MGRESIVHSACSMLLRMLSEQRWNLQYVFTTIGGGTGGAAWAWRPHFKISNFA